MKKHLFKYSALTMAACLTLGVAAVAGASSGSIDTTGPDSYNKISQESDMSVRVENDNHAYVDNDVDQDADSGDAEVEHNTTGGSAETGDAENSSSMSTSFTIDNSEGVGMLALPTNGANSGSIDTTGPDSYNRVEFESEVRINVDNDNFLTVRNDIDQDADSGDAEVEGNTTGGDAISGDATNTSTFTTTINITN